MINPNYAYSELTSKIIGCAMTVHSTLGNGFLEIVYQRALAIEMNKNGISFEQEKGMPIFYDRQLVGTRRADFIVEGVVVVELKAILNTDNAHIAQTFNYLEAHNIEIGLLINFGASRLEFKRLKNDKFKPLPS
ncbi:GxxExxY protein [Chitinophaga flava]|uniref:GxxExxY protein n=1 Tax=Chitinophaga flava TaxID=2259036 RepID=A0A365Y3Y4_9BACT|nr:GxxExxY protein [Chitinophaga flava]RBL93293.1 GxxExxY protein [Chitinophaga flava]